MNYSIAYAGATIASFCVALASVFAGVMAPALLREPLRSNVILGFGAAVVGTAALTGLVGAVGGASILGVGAGLFAALSFALFLVLSRRWVGRYRLSGSAVSLAIALTIGLGMLAIELAFERQAIWPADIRPDALLGVAWLSVMVGVAAQLFLVASARRLEVPSSAALLLLKPVATAVIAALFLGELLQPVQLVGATLVLAGIALAERRPQVSRPIASSARRGIISRSGMEAFVTSADVEVRNPSGLHARPAAAFVKAAATFSSRIRLENLTSGRPAGDAKSLLGLLACGVAMGHHVRITAEGVDEQEAVNVLRTLIEGGLGEPTTA